VYILDSIKLTANITLKKVLTFLFVFVTIIGSAFHGDKEFLDCNFDPVIEESGAMYYRISFKGTDSLFICHVYYLNETLQMRGEYLDKELTILNGTCSFYYKNGQKECEGAYSLNKRVGTWKRYDLFGEPKADKYYPINPVVDEDEFKTCMASYKGGERSLNAFLYENMLFPEDAIFDGLLEGEVNINLELDEEGYVVGYEVLASDSEYFSQEAIRLITTMPQWNPALRNGKAVDSAFIICIPFVFVDSKEVQKD